MSSARQLDAGAGMIAHLVPGDGDRILWIHGYSLDSRIWHELWCRLDGWTHIGIDLPGHGHSAPAPPGVDLVPLARVIGRFAKDQNVRHLVGLSFGGMVALQVAIEFPDVFASMVLGAPALGGGPQDRRIQALNLELSRMYHALGHGPWLTDLWLTWPSDIFTGASKQPALWRRLREIAGEHAWTELADRRMQRLTSHRQDATELRRIRAASLVLVGDEDAAAFKRCAELIRRAIPACRRVYLEHTGHLTLLERAATVHSMIDAHLRAA
jgi:pimeloyl-ACP methyl ester carboxylesterase